MLNYGILQNDQISIHEIEGEMPIFDLSLYEEFGDEALKVGNEDEAINWYTRGLAQARELQRQDKIELFTNLILVSL